MARSVDIVWNFAKSTQIEALKRKSARIIEDKKTKTPIAIPNFLSAYELNNLSSGSSRLLGLHSQTIQAVCEEYVERRKQFKKLLRWRGKGSLGWIPFKKTGIKIEADALTYTKKRFRFWKSRDLPQDAIIKEGSFTQDSRGRWYVSITFESQILEKEFQKKRDTEQKEIGIDLGVKILAVSSEGEKIERPDLRAKHLEKLRKLEKQRRFARRQQARNKSLKSLPKSKQVRNTHAKTANQRNDYLHKESTKLTRKTKALFVGNLRCSLMNRNQRLSGISLDSAIGSFRRMLRYKSIRDGVVYDEISERNSTQTCSHCEWKHPQYARIGLGVREWICPQCDTRHDRDVNAAKNILRMGHHALIRSVT